MRRTKREEQEKQEEQEEQEQKQVLPQRMAAAAGRKKNPRKRKIRPAAR